MTELLTIPEAAARLGDVSTRTVYRLVNDGKLTIVKVRGGSRIRGSDIDRYLRANERTTAA